MYRQKYLTQREIEELINASSDEEETATLSRNADRVDLVLLPPPKVDDVSDLEDIDEESQILNDVADEMPLDVAGEIEVVCEFDDDNVHKPNRQDDDDIVLNSQKLVPEAKGKIEPKLKRERKKKEGPTFQPKWSKGKRITFAKQPVNVQEEKMATMYEKFGK